MAMPYLYHEDFVFFRRFIALSPLMSSRSPSHDFKSLPLEDKEGGSLAPGSSSFRFLDCHALLSGSVPMHRLCDFSISFFLLLTPFWGLSTLIPYQYV